MPASGTDKPRQLPLDLAHEPGFSRDELIVSSSNQAAVALIDRWPDWNASLMVIAGPPGSGKSHLASIWAHNAQALAIDPAAPGDLANAVESGANILIDGVGELPLDENALFHLINASREAGRFVLMTSRRWPSQWPIKLPDLMSRIKSAPMVEIAEPDDELLSGVLLKLFSDRQIIIDPLVVRYLVSRIERSLATAQDIVARIDRAALENQGRITRQLAASVLTEMDSGQKSLDL
ncbi:MAG: DnaA regulatory inactivator HdaA [Rhizobiaceae bacterium]